eukprot:9312455-Pyramimonas_sp.AAC.1
MLTRWCHASTAIGELGRHPMGPRNVRGGAVRALSLGPSVELSMGPRNVSGVGMSAAVLCERSHYGPRWSSPWGHGACEDCAEMPGRR